MQIVRWTLYCLGCVAVAFAKVRLESHFQLNEWVEMAGGLTIYAFGLWLFHKCQNPITRVVHWVADKWV